jgi:hypothetical protein
MSTLGIIKISEPDRLDAVKSMIVEHRQSAKSKAAYELYGIDYNSNRLRITLIDHAPTSGDFGPKIAKRRIAQLIDLHPMVVEFRGAWKSDAEGKVVAYESQQQADFNATR